MSTVYVATAVVKTKGGPSGSLYTEEDWNDEATVETNGYRFSKVCASYMKFAMDLTHQALKFDILVHYSSILAHMYYCYDSARFMNAYR